MSNWWLDTGLDGIISGVIGGLVTAGAVVATIRHERKMRDEERQVAAKERAAEDAAAARRDLRSAAVALHAQAIDLRAKLVRDDRPHAVFFHTMDLLSAIAMFEAATSIRPRMAEARFNLVRIACRELIKLDDESADKLNLAMVACTEVADFLAEWLADPRSVESPTSMDRLRESAGYLGIDLDALEDVP